MPAGSNLFYDRIEGWDWIDEYQWIISQSFGWISYDQIMEEPIDRLAKKHEAIMLQMADFDGNCLSPRQLDFTKAIANCFKGSDSK